MLTSASSSRLLKRSAEICRFPLSPVVRCLQIKIRFPRQRLDDAGTLPKYIVKVLYTWLMKVSVKNTWPVDTVCWSTDSDIFIPCRHVTCPCALQASSSSSVPSDSSHAGHAFLHDFCMSLPYAAISMIAATALSCLGAKQAAVPLFIGGATVAIASILSLKKWKADKSSSVLTLLIGGGHLHFCCLGLKLVT